MNLRDKFPGIIRYFSLIFISLIVYPLTGQQVGPVPFITLVSPSAIDSLNNSGKIQVRAEIVSRTTLQEYRIMLNESIYVNEAIFKPKQKDSITYVIESFVPLKEGKNLIYAEAKNTAGTARSRTQYVINQIEPFVNWLLPVSVNSSTESATVNVKAEIKTILDLQRLRINLNGTNSTDEKSAATRRNDETYIFEKTIRLKPGKNTILISAGNAKGENKSSTRVITFGQVPVISLVSPSTTDSLNNSDRIQVRAEIISSTPLQTYRIMLNDKVFADETMFKPNQKDSITYVIETLVPVNEGSNSIFVEAKNALGSESSEKRTVFSQSRPFVSWIFPESTTSTTGSGTLIIRAEVITSLELQKVSINFNGTVLPVEKGDITRVNNVTYGINKTLPNVLVSKNTVFISATNNAGTTNSLPRNINYSAANKPVITIAAMDSLSNSGTIPVKAVITSRTTLQEYKIMLNESSFADETILKPSQKDSITYVIETLVPLKEGRNTIYLEAKNVSGTESSERRIILYQSKPFITWIQPELVNTTTESGTLNIKAQIKTFIELKNVSINLNGTIIPGEAEDITRMNDGIYVFNKTLQNVLSSKNTVFLSATNSIGITTSVPRNISYMAGTKPVINIAATDSLNNSGILLFSAEIVSKTRLQAVRLVQNGSVVGTETTKNPEQKDSITYIVKGLFPLRAGINTFYLEAKNTIGTEKSEARTIICQPAPIIKWISPASASVTAGSETLKIKAEITTSLDLLNAGVNINGTSISNPKEGITRVNNDTYTLERTVSLKAGENNIFLVADNARGSGNSPTRTVIYVPGVISEIKWVTPSVSNSDTRKADLPVSATVTTKSDIKSMRLFLNGTELTSVDRSKTARKNNQEYSYENILTLKPGANTIELSAVTGDGTVTSEKRTITYSPPVLPSLAWQNPVFSQSEVNQASLDLRMNIKSADELSNIAVYLNGQALDNVSLSNSVRKENEDFVLGSTIVLKPGDNTLYVSAGNIAGLATSETRNIKYSVQSMPVIAWENPGTGVSTLSTSTITVTANITSTTELKDLKIYHNNNPLPGNLLVTTIDKQQGVYHVEGIINLNQGENRIYIVAGNMAGNTTSETRQVSYAAASAPVIAWVKPSNPSSLINLPSAEISATVKSSEKLQSLMVYVNGVGSEEINQITPTGSQGEYLFKKMINLQPGNNTIYLLATNNVKAVKSDDRLLTNPPPSKPLISWAIPSEPSSSSSSDMIIVEACIKSSSDLNLVQIFVNSVQWASETMFQASQTEDCNYRFTRSVLLKEGDNTVFINATNSAGTETSERRTIRFQKGIAERRLALVLGNSEYGNTLALKNPVNDANLIEGTLKTLGFEVIKRLNAKKAEMEQAIREFSEKLPDYNVALFYYAGHGIQVGGENYLIPTDAVLDKESDCQWEAIQVNTIVRQFEQVPENINIIILDACRDNPFKSWSRGAPQGFKMLNTVSGTFVAFATSENSTAADGLGFNGVYTEELVKQMDVPQSISGVFNNTRRQVMQKTNNRQVPTESSKLVGDFYFKK
jgi:DNA-binding protein